ncbi:MAG: PD-(D/E)XK nuclease family protein [Candidatus Poribacteria bacterium]|nr:PD-(D/E)XK nuclease family protein [Candidatus Poribacteria bacterium]MDE0503854.1 PD-(D/E)XK nuclease family protein [Candidatus Poribacteria bacterium]
MHTVLTNGKTSHPIDDAIRERFEMGEANAVLFIVPTEQARLKRQRECLEHASRRSVAGLNVCTFDSFAKRLSEHACSQRPISRGLQMLLLREIVDGGQYPSLKSAANIPLPQRAATELLNRIIQLKTDGVDASQMRVNSADSAHNNLHTDKKTLSDIVALWEHYNAELGNQWIDCADVHRAIINRLVEDENRGNQLMRAGFPDVRLVVAEGVDISSRANLSILEGISRCPRLVMYVTFDWDAGNQVLFGHTDQIYNRFLEVGFQQVNESRNRPSRTTTWSQYFSRNLFGSRGRTHSSVKKLNVTDKITLVRTNDRVKEVEAAAELIKKRMLNGLFSDSHRICLTYFNLDRYARLISEIFPNYGVPYVMDDGIRLSTSRCVTGFFALLERIEESVSSSSEPVLLNTYFFIEDLATLIADCDFGEVMLPSEFSASVARLIQITRVRQQILNQVRAVDRNDCSSTMEKAICAFQNVEFLIAELMEFLITRYGDEQSYSLRSYIDKLKMMASETTGALTPKDSPGVSVLPLVHTKELDFDTVILGGLVDGEFPARIRQNTVPPSNQNLTVADSLREQRFLFYQVLNLFQDHLYLMAPASDNGIDLIQSPFINELQRNADISTDRANADVIFSPERLLAHYGKFVWAQSEDGFNHRTPLPFRITDPSSSIPAVLPVVEHSVRVEKSRSITRRLPQYEGRLILELLTESSRNALENLRDRIYSVRELESYGQCPFQYFTEHVLSEPEQGEVEDEDGPTSLGKGLRLHEILSEFYIQRCDKPAIANCTDLEFDEALKELKQVAEDIFSVCDPENLFWEVEMETIIGGKGKLGILPHFLIQERERDLELEPRYFEVGFGRGHSSTAGDATLSSSKPVKVGGVNLAGTIDRVEIGDRVFAVGDYTTGVNVPKIRSILEGRNLQLPIYLIVAEQLLKRRTLERFHAVGGIYYILHEKGRAELGLGDKDYNGIAFKASARNRQLLPGTTRSNSNPMSTDFDVEEDTFQSVIDQSVLFVSEYVSSISEGQFPLTPHDPKDVCRYCESKRICRIGAISDDDADR